MGGGNLSTGTCLSEKYGNMAVADLLVDPAEFGEEARMFSGAVATL